MVARLVRGWRGMTLYGFQRWGRLLINFGAVETEFCALQDTRSGAAEQRKSRYNRCQLTPSHAVG